MRSWKLVAFAACVLLIVGGTVTFLVVRTSERDSISTTSTWQTADPASLPAGPRVYFRSAAPDDSYGKVAAVSAGDPTGPRAVTDLTCDRIDTRDTGMVCLSQTGLGSTFSQEVLDARGEVLLRNDLPGLPSRTRFSPSGAFIASTGFVAGDSYLDVGFSTRTYITNAATGERQFLEDFTLTVDGEQVRPVDRNFWGVSFADDDTFYVTVSFGNEYWLARGSMQSRSIETVHDRAECPSLSPDGSRVVYKKRQGGDNSWRLAVLELATNRERLLEETRSVDDQVAWLDHHTILYGLPPASAREGESDVWALNIDGGEPALFIRQGSSPSVT